MFKANYKKTPSMLIKQIEISFRYYVDQVLAKYDITTSQFRVLMLVVGSYYHQEKINQRKIEENLHISNPTVSGILNRLESKEQIYRLHEGRNCWIYPCDKTLELAENLHTEFGNSDDKLVEGFSDQEKEQLMNFLERMIKNIKGGCNK